MIVNVQHNMTLSEIDILMAQTNESFIIYYLETK